MSRRDSQRGNWTPKRIARLIELWNEGLPIRVMGHLLGITPNAVIGKKHRLGLPNRERRRRRQDRPKPTPILAKPEPLEEVEIEQPNFDAYPVPTPDPTRCNWPVGVMGTKGFHWCGKKPMFGKQFCFDHEAMAYTARRVGDAPPLPHLNARKDD